MLQTMPSIIQRLQEEPIPALRDFFKERPRELIALFDQYVNLKEWVEGHPSLGLKAFALLDPGELQTETSLKTLRIIFAARALFKDFEGVIKNVIQDAAHINNWAFVFRLIEYGASVDIILNNDQTLLHLSCLHGVPESALQLIALGAKIDCRNYQSETPLHLASGNDLIEVSRMLLENGADPFALDVEGRTPIQYACILGSLKLLECFKVKFQRFEWPMLLAATFLDIGKEAKAFDILERASLFQSFGPCLDYAVRFPKLMRFLIPRFGKDVDYHVERIRAKTGSMTVEQKLACLPLLSPAMIAEVMNQVPLQTCQSWLNRMIVVEEVSESDKVVNTVFGGLKEINEVWLPFIEWNDSDSASYSSYLMRMLSLMLRKIELPVLSFASMNKELSPVIETCFPILEFDQMAVVVPHFNKDRFMSLCQSCALPKQIVLLKLATNDQKLHFIKKPLPSDPLVLKWHYEKYEYFNRGIELLYDCRYVQQKEPRELFLVLIAKFEEVSQALPFAVKKDQFIFEKLKEALMLNSPSLEVRNFVLSFLNPLIYKNSLVENQLEKIGQCLYQDPLYKQGLGAKKAEPPLEFLCGIYQTTMEDPVIAHGHAFEREAITTWLQGSDACPICRSKVSIQDFVEDSALRQKIEIWKKQKGD